MTLREHTQDEGMTLVEVVVTIFLLGLLAVAVLPLAMQSTVLSASNRERATANAFASSVVTAASAPYVNAYSQTCANVNTHLTTLPLTAPNGSGVTAVVRVPTSPCATGVGVQPVTVCVFGAGVTPVAASCPAPARPGGPAPAAPSVPLPLVMMSTQIFVAGP